MGTRGQWQVQEAKQKLSQLLQASVNEGPQIISRHGQELAVVLSMKDYSQLRGGADFKELLRSAPDFDML